MANHKSAIKKIRADKKKTRLNKFLLRTCKNSIKELKKTESKDVFQQMLPSVISKLHRLGNKNIIHKNNAARKISALHGLLNRMA